MVAVSSPSGTNDRVVSGHVESFEVDADTGEVVLSVRLDPDESHGDLSESEVVLDGPLYLPESVEGTILDLLDALSPGE